MSYYQTSSTIEKLLQEITGLHNSIETLEYALKRTRTKEKYWRELYYLNRKTRIPKWSKKRKVHYSKQDNLCPNCPNHNGNT